MPPTQDEIETKYDVADDFVLPPAAELMAGSAEGVQIDEVGVDDYQLESTYFDTADLRLFHAGLTLRRRTGGKDDGWHLKVPLSDGVRREIQVALGRSATTVPLRLRRLVWVHTRDEPLVPVLRLVNARSEHHLSVEGRPVADLADDRVTATRLLIDPVGDAAASAAGGDSTVLTWRELEVELTGDDPKVLKRVGRQLRGVGARPSVSASKLARGLGARPDPLDQARRKQLKRARKQLSPTSPAGDVIVTYLAGQLDQLLTRDLQVRLDRPDSLHQMRVATRRLRSALATFGLVFEPGVVEPLAAELKWLADELGAARDAEVLRLRLQAAVGSEQARHLSTSRVAQTVDREMARRQRAASAAALAALETDRYRGLVATLEALVADPPLSPQAAKSARKQLRRPVLAAYAQVRDAVLGGAALPPGDERDELLHTARKVAKRARYSAEAVAPAFGRAATTFALAMEHLQVVLGERQDSVAMQARLFELAREATPAAAFTYGRLHARESVHQDLVDASILRSWKVAAKPLRRAWLT